MKFNELELIEPLIEAVNQMNYKEASPIPVSYTHLESNITLNMLRYNF